MPQPGYVWRHVVFSTYGSWLPGDPRGWRSREHRVHSSGDYRLPPRETEHAGLHRHSQQISRNSVIIPNRLRSAVGRTLLNSLEGESYRAIAISVGGQHLHLLAELPQDLKQTKRILGKCKGQASHAVRNDLPGRLWARDGRFGRIRDRTHHRRVYRYILDHVGEGAWTWSVREGESGPPR